MRLLYYGHLTSARNSAVTTLQDKIESADQDWRRSPSNFANLSQLGQSDKKPQEPIGNKGIGFRSVLEITTSPEIYSRAEKGSTAFDGFCFAFSTAIIDHLVEDHPFSA